MPGPTLTARLLVDLNPLLGDYVDDFAAGVDTEGAIYAAGQKSTESRHDFGGRPKSYFEQPADYLVVRWQDGDLDSMVVSDGLVISHVQPTSDGLLFVGARSRSLATGLEQNAVAYDWSGQELRRFTLGDGINDVRVSPDGSIWAGYFDEGIAGSIGLPGLVKFDAQGHRQFAYSAEQAGTRRVIDLYAMNLVGNDDIWFHFRKEFPIVHLDRGQYQVWPLGEHGFNALAVDAGRALLLDGYGSHEAGVVGQASVVVFGNDGESSVTGHHPVVDSDGLPFDRRRTRMRGVGPNLYLFQDRKAYVLDDW